WYPCVVQDPGANYPSFFRCTIMVLADCCLIAQAASRFRTTSICFLSTGTTPSATDLQYVVVYSCDCGVVGDRLGDWPEIHRGFHPLVAQCMDNSGNDCQLLVIGIGHENAAGGHCLWCLGGHWGGR